MILPDHELRKFFDQAKLVSEPLDPEVQIQPAGIDLQLGNEFRVLKASSALP